MNIPDIFAPSTANYVVASAEWHRINLLPRRTWTIEEAEELSRQLSPMLKTASGTMALLAVQAICLREAWAAGGLFAAISVSAGKTLLSLLLPRILGAKNPALLVPAKLKRKPGQRGLGKTEKDIQEYSRHWDFRVLPTLISDESLGPVSGKGTLDELAPDLIIIDEAHKFRNPKASRTKKLARYLKEHPDCKVCCLSGTISKRAFADYAHILKWCLKGGSPMPTRHDIVEEWDAALGEGSQFEFTRLGPGALLNWALPGEIDALGPLNAARAGVQRRLSETPGVVCYHVKAEDIDAEITIRGINTWELPGYENGAIEQAFAKLRPGKDAEGNATGWELPDGQELVEGLEIFRHAYEESLGFFAKWKDPAPKEWLEKRKAFNTFIREHLSMSRKYDSPDEVAQSFPTAEAVVEWKKIRASYKPETIIVWLDSGPLKLCVDWLKGGGIAFVQHTKFGEALAQLAGVPYFGAGGVDSAGRSIEDFQGTACVASVFANGEGRNLHLRPHPLNPNIKLGFSRMLLVSMLRNWLEWEQTIGRIHRLGCLAEHCDVDVLIGCREHVKTFEQCILDAERTKYAEGGHPKLLQATIENIISSYEMPKGLDAFK